ncbi:MAG: tetratricopeptide repeat protein, partial [Flavobacteriales bacterium]|nr:tetratricopeptide repeat protein [Flavobacteriales bacterium]
ALQSIGLFEKGEKYMEIAYELNPEYSNKYHILPIMKLVQSNECVKAYSKLKKDQDLFDYEYRFMAYNEIGNCYSAGGNFKLSVEIYDSLISHIDTSKSTPITFAMLYFNRANAHLSLKNYPEAERDYLKALSIKPEYNKCLYNLGIARISSKKYQDACEPFQTILKSQIGDQFRIQVEKIVKELKCD